MFSDVPAGCRAAGFIVELHRERVTGACGFGRYCPEPPVRRDEMAAFLVRGLRLP